MLDLSARLWSIDCRNQVIHPTVSRQTVLLPTVSVVQNGTWWSNVVKHAGHRNAMATKHEWCRISKSGLLEVWLKSAKCRQSTYIKYRCGFGCLELYGGLAVEQWLCEKLEGIQSSVAPGWGRNWGWGSFQATPPFLCSVSKFQAYKWIQTCLKFKPSKFKVFFQAQSLLILQKKKHWHGLEPLNSSITKYNITSTLRSPKSLWCSKKQKNQKRTTYWKQTCFPGSSYRPPGASCRHGPQVGDFFIQQDYSILQWGYVMMECKST